MSLRRFHLEDQHDNLENNHHFLFDKMLLDTIATKKLMITLNNRKQVTIAIAIKANIIPIAG